MSALPNNFIRPFGYDLSQFVPIDVACKLLNVGDGSLRRICREKLQLQNIAILVAPPEGGQAKWFIHRSYHPALRPQDQTRTTDSDLSMFTGKQRTDAYSRRDCVGQFVEAMRNGKGQAHEVTARMVRRLKEQYPKLRISRTRLYAWAAAYKNPCDLAKLIDHRGGDHSSVSSPEAWLFFRTQFLHENRLAKRHCWKLTKREAEVRGWQWCSYTSCVRQLNDQIPPQQQTLHRDPAKFRTALEPYIEQDVDAWGAGENYVGDHKTLDVLCRYGKSIIRPSITAWMDWKTRKICGWVLSAQPNSQTILAALRQALMDPENMGGPSHVHIDNGKDFSAWLFHGQTKTQRRENRKIGVDEQKNYGIFSALHITPHFSIPFGPNGKARLERWFGTINSFTRHFDSYTGSNIEDKPERLAEIVKQPHKLPTFAQLEARLKDHIAGLNANIDHQMDDLMEDGARLSPNEAFAKWVTTKRVMADPKSLDLLLAYWHKPVYVGRNGIRINLAGVSVGYGQFAPELARFKGIRPKDRKPVLVAYDPHDLKTIHVYDESLTYVCPADMNRVGGAHGTKIALADVAEANHHKVKYKKDVKHIHDPKSVVTTFLSIEECAALNAADRQDQIGAAQRIDPPSLKIIQTPLDGQGEEIERQKVRKAVGAESVTETPSGPSLLERLRGNLAPKPREDAPIDLLAKLRSQNHEW